MTYANAATVSTSSISVNTSAIDAVLHASPIVQIVLLILVGLSVVCWAVGITKWKQFREIQRTNEPFFDQFWKTTSLDSLYEELESYNKSSAARVFKAGY